MAIDATTRRMMGEQAVSLARKVGYSSAGTVEFLVDKHRNFYFLEMNTRLQVEHPITEYITGIDLVEQMIRVAASQSLSLRQADVKINGWAFESRIYAEDPKLFLPSIGRLKRYIEPLPLAPSDTPEVRCDSGIREGAEISIYYDPLICKLCTHGSDRATALSRMQGALDSYVIRGVTHNIPLIREVISQRRFQEGRITTKYLTEEFPRDGFTGHQLTEQEQRQLALAAVYVYDRQWERLGATAKEDVIVMVEGIGGEIVVGGERTATDMKIVGVPDAYQIKSDWRGVSSPMLNLTVNDEPLTLQYHGSPYLGSVALQAFGTVYTLAVLTRLERDLAKHLPANATVASESQLLAPMAGQIVSVAVKVGDTVREGGELLVIEAMKMQNVLRAPKAAKVVKLHVEPGKNVSADQCLLELEYL